MINNALKKIITKKIYLFIFALIFYLIDYKSNDIKNKNHIKKIIEEEKLKNINLILSNFVSYSQDFEDFILFYLFYDVDKGFYIDVGANDPNYISVTKAFYEKGWNGINIEPLPFKYQLLNQFRKRDINLQVGAGKMKSNATLEIICPNGVCSSIFHNYKLNNTKIINIKIETMSNICRKYVPIGTEIQFCKIDVERAEKYVLLGFDFRNYRPKVFCIESLFNKKTKIPEYKEWEYILIENNYSFAYSFRRNRFYFDNRIKSLKDRFNSIDYYVKIYYRKYLSLKKLEFKPKYKI